LVLDSVVGILQAGKNYAINFRQLPKRSSAMDATLLQLLAKVKMSPDLDGGNDAGEGALYVLMSVQLGDRVSI